jgi:hypothetical protein
MPTRCAQSSLGFTAEMAPTARTLSSPISQSEVPLYEGPSAAKAIHFAACAAANFEIKTKTDFQADSLLPGELELSYY